MTESLNSSVSGLNNPSAVILIAEDEPEIAEILSAYLLRNGMRTIYAENGQKALELHTSHKPDLILLDVQMPELDGWQVLSEIRHRGDTPVIMLTAMDQDIDKLMGLRIGADDYVVKPFNPAEVVARVQAVLRRTGAKKNNPDSQTLRLGNLEIDLENYQVTVHNEGQKFVLNLTLTEFKLLVHLARKPKRVFSRSELLVACLPEGETLDRTVDSHMSKLRKKLELVNIYGVPTGVRGVGYKFGESE